MTKKKNGEKKQKKTKNSQKLKTKEFKSLNRLP
jgi:hypothetical protein